MKTKFCKNVVGRRVISFLGSNRANCPPPTPSYLSALRFSEKNPGRRLKRSPDGVYRRYWDSEESLDKPRPSCVRYVGGGRRRRGRTRGGEKQLHHRHRYKKKKTHESIKQISLYFAMAAILLFVLILCLPAMEAATSNVVDSCLARYDAVGSTSFY